MRRLVAVLSTAGVLAGLPATAAWAEDTPVPTTPPPTTSPTPTPAPTPEGLPKRLVIGESRKGVPIVARRQGPVDAKRVLLVLGQMHGDEPYGRYVVDQLRRLEPRAGTAIWTIRTLNPDGSAMRTRRNANQVDLNRNFPDDWQRGTLGSLYYSGPEPASEPETRAFIKGAEQIRPDAVVSYHQHLSVIDNTGRPKIQKWTKRLSRDLRLPISRVSCITKCAGTLTGWFNSNFRGWAITVELPRAVTKDRQRSMARSMVRLVPDLKPTHKR